MLLIAAACWRLPANGAAEPLESSTTAGCSSTAKINGVQTEAPARQRRRSHARSIRCSPLQRSSACRQGHCRSRARAAKQEAQRRSERVRSRSARADHSLRPEAVVIARSPELSTRLIKRPTRAIIGREVFDAAQSRHRHAKRGTLPRQPVTAARGRGHGSR